MLYKEPLLSDSVSLEIGCQPSIVTHKLLDCDCYEFECFEES